MKFVRFVVADETEDAWKADGVITVLCNEKESGSFDRYQDIRIDEIFDWLNSTLEVPPFRQNIKSGKWSRDSICWFKDNAHDMMEIMWEIVYMLREIGLPARMVVANQVGKILYEDQYQVVAKVPRYSNIVI